MDSRFTAEALIQLVHRYYPAGVHRDDPSHSSTEEHQRLEALRQAAVQDVTSWEAFLQRIRDELPGCRVWDYPTIRYDPAREARVAQPNSSLATPEVKEVKEVVLLVSILAPVHCLYASQHRYTDSRRGESTVFYSPLPSEYQAYEAKVDQLVEAFFSSVRLPNEVLFTPVPDLQVGNTGLGQAKLIDCLFTDHRW
ncbi:hypothetical protein [Hyalangium rubrum]|uniref:Uncharacterized protein n=1 Tax=Hyalangium rubrum TaxID=3103134 RepID=A0ABU5HI81_9BACT|nr:hypothetical protein [Hyalangium sp. s54d21]MDY7232965.1 hypothetical protein [Hyalangium sp. s54d21]